MKQTTIFQIQRWIAKSAVIASFLIGTTLFFGEYAVAITIAPARFDDVVLLAGTVIQKELVVYNEENQTKTYTLVAQNFVAGDETGAPEFLTSGEYKGGLASWIRFGVSSITLSAGETERVPFAINVPSNAVSGGYSAAVFLVASSGGVNGVTVGQTEKIGALVLGNVPGEIQTSARVEDFRVEKKLHSELPRRFYATIENVGGSNLRPEVGVEVVSMFGRTVAEHELNAERGYILPGSQRRFDSVNEAESKDEGFFKTASRQLKYFAFGPYKTRLMVEDQDLSESAQLWIWVFPWQVMIVIAVFFAAIFFGQKFFRRWMKKHSYRP